MKSKDNEKLDVLVENRTSELIRAKNDAENANRKKTQFLSRVSHELRTPLNAILGFAQLLESEVIEVDHREMITEISVAGHHLMNIIDEVLELSKIEAGNIRTVIGDVVIKDVIAECLSIAKMHPLASSITFEDKSTELDDFVVRADETKLKEVILNLLTNAVKYNKKNGKVSIDYEITKYNMLRLRVVDTGIGISESNFKLLFEPFNRMGAELTDIEGTGIGLTICRELMGHMHGNIGANSVENSGSEFWIDCQLSTTLSQKLMKPDKSMMSYVGEDITLLCIEDNASNRRLMEQVISRKTNFTIEFSINAEEGLAKARSMQPSIVLMDVNLPGMDGYEALKIIQTEHELKHIPVIALSAAATIENFERGLQAGFKYYLTKPLDTNELIEKILAVVSCEKRQAS